MSGCVERARDRATRPLCQRAILALTIAVFSTMAACLMAATIWCADAFAAEPLSQEDYAVVSAICKPGDGEDAWASIPWEIDLWRARRAAAEAGKPIVLWEMDGHPLGCT